MKNKTVSPMQHNSISQSEGINREMSNQSSFPLQNSSFNEENKFSALNIQADEKANVKYWAGSKNKFITIWQAIFNRRIVSFSSFALQVGDLFILILPPLYVLYSYTSLTGHEACEETGGVVQVLMAITIIFACRNGLLSFVFGLSLERSILWHQYLAWNTLIASFRHWDVSEEDDSGYFLEYVLIAFIALSIKPIRRYFWEIFMLLHWILTGMMVAACFLHEVGLPLFATVYLLLDILYRVFTICQFRRNGSQAKLEKVGSNIVKLTLARGQIQFEGGQYFFVMIPRLSYFEWHPFSTFSSAHDKEIVIYVKNLGKWTENLFKIAGVPGQPTTVSVYVEGPYGSHSIAISDIKYKNFLCFAGGIGVTPIISTVKDILYESKLGRPVSNLSFIWTGRERSIVESIINQDELISLLPTPNSSILKTFYHLSSGGAAQSGEVESRAGISSLPVLQKGRPDINKYFELAHSDAAKSNHPLVAVIVCGPQPLIDSVEIMAQRWSKEGIRFDVHQEVFLF